MKNDLFRKFERICNTGAAVAGYGIIRPHDDNHSCCYEVREDVCERFRESFSDMECEMLFKKMNDEGCCTYHTSTFSSWRRTGDRKKQMLTYIMLQ